MKYKQTPSQTIGPFFAHGLTPEQYRYSFTSIAQSNMVDSTVEGEHVIIRGKVFDGEGNAVNDAMLEFWQCNEKGLYVQEEQKPHQAGFMGFARTGTGTREDYSFEVKTIKPASIHGQAPHINVIVFMRGALNHQYTRIYFSDEETLNEHDPILRLVPKDRRRTLFASREEKNGMTIYHFDIHMQGENETVFFDV